MSAETALAAAPGVPAGDEPAENAAVAESAETLTPALSQGEREMEAAAAEPAANTLTPALSHGEREAAAERIRSSQLLPPAIREVLARVTLASAEAAPTGATHVPIDDVVRAVEEALPEFLQGRRAEVQLHPAGDVFFSGDPEALSEEQAEEIARAQLARSGLLRGQRVRAAD